MSGSFEDLTIEQLQDLSVELAELIGKLIFVGTMMAQELQEFVDSGVEAGSDMAATKAMLEEWEGIYRDVQHLE